MYRWTAIVFVLLLIGCSSSSTLPTNEIHAAGKMGSAGGALSGSFAGSFTEIPCGMNSSGVLSFGGSGKATFIGRSSESGTMAAGGGACVTWRGSASLVSRFHPANTLTVSLTFNDNDHNPCNDPRHHQRTPASWAVSGGTGKFAHATGSGTVTLICDFSNHTYTDTWTGAIHF